MMGKMLVYTTLAGATLGIYTVISSPTHFNNTPPLHPIKQQQTVTVTVTPTPKQTVPWGKPGGPVEPQYPFNEPPSTPTPTRWPGQHYGEKLV
jgi:hypothetical protein